MKPWIQFFNAIIGRLIALQHLEKPKVRIWGFAAWNPNKDLPIPIQSPHNHFFLYKTQSSVKKHTLVKVLGQIPDFILNNKNFVTVLISSNKHFPYAITVNFGSCHTALYELYIYR